MPRDEENNVCKIQLDHASCINVVEVLIKPIERVGVLSCVNCTEVK